MKSMRVIITLMAVLGLIGCCLLSGCAAGRSDGSASESSVPAQAGTDGEVQQASKKIFAMDTYMTITCYGDKCSEALDAAVEEVERLDALLSIGSEDSEVSLLNSQGSLQLSDDTLKIVQTAIAVSEKTGGLFDITIYPVVQLWGFTGGGEKSIPDEDSLREELKNVGSSRLSLERDVLTLGDGQQVELGGIAKGYTSDRLMEIFEEYELVSAFVSLGGNAQIYGLKPDGTMYKCGIVDPNNAETRTSYLGTLTSRDQAVITSGAYERCFVGEDGKTYHHIIDPRTGYPAESGLKSVTIVAESGILADALSTSVYIMGLDEAEEFWRNSGYEFDMILMTDDNTIYITEGIQDNFTSKKYEVKVITE